MKKILRTFAWLLLGASGLVSCVDKAYDLEKIDSDGISIGDDDSEFRIPVATIRVKTREIVSGDMDISALIDDVNVWLPSALPDGVDYLDVTRLEDNTYINKLLDALYVDMGNPATGKLDAVADFAWTRCRDAFAPLLLVGDRATEEVFKTAFRTMYTQDVVRAEARRQAEFYLSGLAGIDPLVYDLGSLGIADDVVDMLADNLDPAGTPDAVNTLSLYGTIVCRLPLSFRLGASLASTGIDFSSEIVAGSESNPIREVRIYAEDLRTLADGTSITLPVLLQRYYPGMDFSQDPAAEQISVSLSLVKRGPLAFEF